MSALPTFFKIIGEVSKLAVWIKPDIEIDEDEVCRRYELEIYHQEREQQFYNRTEDLPIDREIKLKDDPYYNETIIHESIVFKCPTCKIFH